MIINRLNFLSEKVVIVIPAFNPDEKFISLLFDLNQAGFKRIIIINDGSSEDTACFFYTAEKKYGCKILKHSINLGQGRAYKTAYNYYLSEVKIGGCYEHTIGIIQCDCDGQHCVEDINRCADLLNSNPEKFILGVRDFTDKNIPFRSRFGNSCTSFVFKFLCGLDLKDTQTGLKGIPRSLIPILMETPGERFEYASSVLLETKKQGVEILQFHIKTIYINGNETSHFKPLFDSIRIYSLILKYLMSSLSAFIIDIGAFSIFVAAVKEVLPDKYIIVSVYLAKVLSCTYSFVVNKRMVFEHRGNRVETELKFILLCLVQASLSGFMTDSFVGSIHWNEILSKIIVDIFLFFVSFQVQSRWIFKKEIFR